MKDNNYWVISPNVTNNQEEEPIWKRVILSDGIAFMGWGDEDKLGIKFINEIKIGDFILIAQGANWQKKLFIGGIVCSQAINEKYPGTPQKVYNRKLFPILNLHELEVLNLDFNNSAYGVASQIPALYKLYPNKTPADLNITEKLSFAIIEKIKSTKMKEILHLLEFKKQIILQGPPGTGKTRMAKEIAKLMTRPDKIDLNILNDFIKRIKIGQIFKTISEKAEFTVKEILKDRLVYQRKSTEEFGDLFFNDIIKAYENKKWLNVKNGSDTYCIFRTN